MSVVCVLCDTNYTLKVKKKLYRYVAVDGINWLKNARMLVKYVSIGSNVERGEGSNWLLL